MKVAVIDAHGSVASRLVETLVLADDESVVAISRHPAQHTLAARFSVDLRLGNPLEVDSLTAALRGCSIAILVGTGSPGELKSLAAAFPAAAAAAKVRKVVYVGSAVVHGPDPPAGTAEDSRTPSKLLDESAAAHAAAERQVLAACAQAGITAHALRPGVVYGPRSPLIAALATELRDERACVLGDGEAIFNGVYTDNLVAAIRLCFKSRSTAGRAFLITDAETVTWNELHRTLARELELSASRVAHVDLAELRIAPSAAQPAPPAEFVTRVPLQQAKSKLASTAAVRDLGYAPVVTCEEGLKRACAWWRYVRGEVSAS